MKSAPWRPALTQDKARLLPEAPWGWYAPASALEILADGFAPISLKQMDAVALLDRTDTKFVLSPAQLRRVLAALQPDYQMLSVQGQRLNHYRTVYFDTPDFQLYHCHVNGRADRYKVRRREYTDTRQVFMEVKHKNSKGRTIKERLPLTWSAGTLPADAADWLQARVPFDSQELEPKLWNTFTRLTLVSQPHCERVTLDVDLTFGMAAQAVPLDGLAIAEVKMDAHNRASPFLAQMRTQKIRPQSFSKYCLGVAWLCDQVKKNTLKPRRLWIEKMIKGAADNE